MKKKKVQHHTAKKDRIRGYWKPKVKASPKNMIELEGVRVLRIEAKQEKD